MKSDSAEKRASASAAGQRLPKPTAHLGQERIQMNSTTAVAQLDRWAASRAIPASAIAFLKTVLLMRLAQGNAHRDQDRARHAESFITVVRVRAAQIIGEGC
ncbi:hypothetical protein [Achromobacter sp. UMC46]|uniref:hypothetical protein n=1 Tax=Achromobacter sp. UMC46 TaxID=1862319 RepID=UPI001601183E|nr:hypothetical protein [Achromobacter sp. UMC46]